MAGCSLVDTVADALIAWFDGHARDLPWRHATAGPWGVLVSEIMLQQTPVSRVEPIWYAWLARWPTPAALAADPPAEAIRAWGRLGYPRRALRLHECATAIVERHAGEVPADLDDLLALPGIGGAPPPPRPRPPPRRAAPEPVPGARLDLVWPEAVQRSRALASLVEDGLVSALDGHRYTLVGDPVGDHRAERSCSGG